METLVHSDEVKKNAIAYQGHEVDGEERNSNQDVELLQSGIPTKMKESGLKLVKFKVAIMWIVIP